MKIGLCICYNIKNYGSVLQALATKKIIEHLGYNYEIINYKKKRDVVFYIKKLPTLFSPYFYYSLRRRKSIKHQCNTNPSYKKQINMRNAAFDLFVDEHFKERSPIYYGYKSLCEGSKNYDAIIVGSDQLWIPSGFSTNFYNLMFVDDNVLKISYATSFGVSKIPLLLQRKARLFVRRFDSISVRELKAKKIINNLDDSIKVEVTADPTLLFNEEQWKDIIPQRKIIDGDYIFCYFLGTNINNREAANTLKKYTSMKIVAIKHEDEYFPYDENFGDITPDIVTPEDFVNLIRNAKYVLTDSYHGSIFSILHHKQFITFYRFSNNDKNSRNSRIDSLFEILKLRDRVYDNDIIKEINKTIDYSSVDKRIQDFRETSVDFIEKALSTIEVKR
mgnify:CR=1 FL=1